MSRHSSRPRVEALEDRRALSTISYQPVPPPSYPKLVPRQPVARQTTAGSGTQVLGWADVSGLYAYRWVATSYQWVATGQ